MKCKVKGVREGGIGNFDITYICKKEGGQF